jgi:hypothetical protein
MRRLSFLVLAACAANPPPATPVPVATPAPVAVPSQPVARTSDDAVPMTAPESLVGDDREWHERAASAVAAKDYYKAKRILLRLVAGYRRERRLAEQHEWVQRQLDADSGPAAEAMRKANLEAVPALPSSFRSARAANVPKRPIPKLALVKSTANQITDEGRWFAEAGPTAELALPSADTLFVLHIDFKDSDTDRVLQSVLLGGWLPDAPDGRRKPGPFPTWIPPTFGTATLGRAIVSDPYTLLVYGDRYLFAFDDQHRLVRAIDLLLWLYPESHIARSPIKVGEFKLTTPEGTASGDLTVKDFGPQHLLQWVQARDNVLYVATSYNGYAKEVKGQTAFVTALDLGTGDVLWRSAPVTANAQDFLFINGALITGYGFTAEPDFVHVLDAATGKTVQKLPVTSSPEHFAVRGSELLVRTYDHDLIFSVK